MRNTGTAYTAPMMTLVADADVLSAVNPWRMKVTASVADGQTIRAGLEKIMDNFILIKSDN